jgi:PAS domain S-box-containing protein
VVSQDIRAWVQGELWHQVPVNIAVIDRGFRLVEANRPFEEKYGEFRGRPCFEVYKNRQTPCENCAARKTFADGKTRKREEQGLLKSGAEIYYLVQMVPLVRENGEIPFVVEMSTDITETKTLEADKLQAERLATVGHTVAGLAHGIKNVLTGVDGGMYLTRTGIQKGDMERMLEGWSMLEENIARISAFVREFLDFSKGHPPLLKPTAPNPVAAKVVDLFRHTAELRGINLSFHPDPAMQTILIDETGLHTALSNLISNALDSCTIERRRDGAVRLTTRQTPDQTVFEVSDNGIGMTEEVKEKVFTRFFSTKGSGQGCGLGLLTTRKIVEAHGGTVSFESTPGDGAVFRLAFPRLSPQGDRGKIDHEETTPAGQAVPCCCSEEERS